MLLFYPYIKLILMFTMQNIASLTAAEAQVVTNDVQSFVPEVGHALAVIVLKHAAFPAGSLALAGQTLRAIDKSAQTFGDALIKNAKPNVLNQATAIKADLIAKFRIAEAAFPV
ncbi:hypothetical protein D9615_004815 [Tricholomella constricta]|uniref:Uncharacterized protein n=1 Tax=Tricholomella constricta TaxID=117010 RepID=A0A8H5HH88_9AGAR|nr:hypothetical protein D9615_004815 [Tricholomella constricta]